MIIIIQLWLLGIIIIILLLLLISNIFVVFFIAFGAMRMCDDAARLNTVKTYLIIFYTSC
jgi:hypothetical protein